MVAATIAQYIPFRPALIREEPDIPDSIHRSTEERALRQIAMRARYASAVRGNASLSQMHLELMRLERGAMQHLPQLTYDERIEFIISAAHLRNVTPRQMEALLNQASDILMLRELNGQATDIVDLTPAQVQHLYRGAYRVTRRPRTGGRAFVRTVAAAP